MTRAIKVGCLIVSAFLTASAFADASCENGAKTRDDFLACMRADTDRDLLKARNLYQSIRPLAKGEKLAALDENFSIWQMKLKSDCNAFGKAFNDWGDEYSPDTDFQIAACRSKIASQEFEFYSWLACPDDMETSDKPKCAELKKALGK
ncbi:hypothetical protein [Paraburkholderia sp. J63]|uniref:hypothetical protein n=1 Tax=Paraburkholderia sp. J63 TaxID=2805434 RepID=UPI002ABD86FD|nr:hypothetical protein [Paraburkholderia sp. J63]